MSLRSVVDSYMYVINMEYLKCCSLITYRFNHSSIFSVVQVYHMKQIDVSFVLSFVFKSAIVFSFVLIS